MNKPSLLKLCVFAFCCLLLNPSCKKPKKAEPVNTPHPLYLGSSNNNKGVQAIVYFQKEMYCGSEFENATNVEAFFIDESGQNPGYLNVGKVSINGTYLKMTNNLQSYSYSDTTFAISPSPILLKTEGTSAYPAMEKQSDIGMPVLADTSAIPYTINRSQGFSVSFNNLTSTDSLIFSISDDNPRNNGLSKKTGIVNGRATFTFYPEELSGLDPTTSANIAVSLAKFDYSSNSSTHFYILTVHDYYRLNVRIN